MYAIKRKLLSVLFVFFETSLKLLYKRDKTTKDILSRLPDGFVFSISVDFSNLSITIQKGENGLRRLRTDHPDLSINFKNIHWALLCFAGVIPQHTAFAGKMVRIKGNIDSALIVTEAIYRLQEIIFPPPVARKLTRKSYKKPIESMEQIKGW